MSELEDALREVRVYAMQSGAAFAVATAPEQVTRVRDALKEADLGSCSGVPYFNHPNSEGLQRWEMRGFRNDTWPLMRRIAHEQALAKGHPGLKEFA